MHIPAGAVIHIDRTVIQAHRIDQARRRQPTLNGLSNGHPVETLLALVPYLGPLTVVTDPVYGALVLQATVLGEPNKPVRVDGGNLRFPWQLTFRAKSGRVKQVSLVQPIHRTNGDTIFKAESAIPTFYIPDILVTRFEGCGLQR